jgi:hypothetical protein
LSKIHHDIGPICKTTDASTVNGLALGSALAANRGEPRARPGTMVPMPNRLAQEASPYLRQHADNPVDWYAWGEDAFRQARELNRPIHLSVGYEGLY